MAHSKRRKVHCGSRCVAMAKLYYWKVKLTVCLRGTLLPFSLFFGQVPKIDKFHQQAYLNKRKLALPKLCKSGVNFHFSLVTKTLKHVKF